MVCTAVWVFLVGLCLGSFLNVVVHRLPRAESLIYPGSRCPLCTGPIRWYDNIPLLAFLLLRARCRFCGGTIPSRYPLVELAGGLLAIAGYLKWGATPEAPIAILSLLAFLGIALVDLDTYIIPDSLCVAVALLGVGFAVVAEQPGTLIDRLFAGFLGAGTIVIVILASRGGMGFGDAKLVASMGIALGLQGLGVALFMGFVMGALAALILLVTRKKKRGDAIPFGPFLSAGAMVALLQGDELYQLYARWSGL